MSSPFASTPGQPPEPESRVPEWITNKPKWFWIAVLVGVWIVGMVIQPLACPQFRGRRDFEQPREPQQPEVQSEQPSGADPLAPGAAGN